MSAPPDTAKQREAFLRDLHRTEDRTGLDTATFSRANDATRMRPGANPAQGRQDGARPNGTIYGQQQSQQRSTRRLRQPETQASAVTAA
jgi:hypothetical protein